MSVWPAENAVAVQFAHRGLLAAGVALARWFHPARFTNGQALRTAVTDFLTHCQPRGTRKPLAWRVLETHGVEHRLAVRCTLDQLVTHAKACQAHGLPTVRAYHSVFGTWPTAAEIRDRLVTHHPQVLPWCNTYLRRRGELRGRRCLLRTAEGRQWLAEQARRVLGRRWHVLVTPEGEAWLFAAADAQPDGDRQRGGRP